MNKLPVIYLVTSKSCGHCTKLKPKIPEIKAAVSDLVAFNHCDVTELPNVFPSEFRKNIKWFPFLIMFNGPDVLQYNAQKLAKNRVRFFILNGEVDSEDNTKIVGRTPIDVENIKKWIVEKIPNLNAQLKTVIEPQKVLSPVEQPRTPQLPTATSSPVGPTCNNSWNLRGKPWY